GDLDRGRQTASGADDEPRRSLGRSRRGQALLSTRPQSILRGPIVRPANPTRSPSRALAALRLTSVVRTESGLVRLALGIVALHVLDDSFLQPQPGTTAADHLIGGLLPFALLMAVATGYRRFRAGARAAITLPLGLLAIAAGAGEAGYYTLTVGPSGDDYTGLLALAAG